MTTIAYRDGVMAGDTQCGANNMVAGHLRKVHDLKRYLVGISGKSSSCVGFVEWIKQVDDISPTRTYYDFADINAIVVCKKSGTVFNFDCSSQAIQIQAPFHAIGSGYELAIGAMAHGATAIEAVNIAKRLNVDTGGRTNYIKIGSGKNHRKKPAKLKGKK